MAFDFDRWGMTSVLYRSGPIEGPLKPHLSTEILQAATDLTPLGLALETPEQLRRRIAIKLGPARRHLRQFNLTERIDLWYENVVLGVTLKKIAERLDRDPSHVARGDSSRDWIRKQMRDANRILGSVRRGRPRKGGVLLLWKLMLS